MTGPASPRLVLHVGLPKSGTTYLQGRLVRNAATMLQRGILVPVTSRERGRGSVAFRAALDLTGRRMGRPAEYVEGGWDALVRTVAGHTGPVVVSHEAFARCTRDQAARAVDDLGSSHEVHVVATVRDPARLLVSSWLEGLKHGTAHDLAEHATRARSGDLPVWRTLDLSAVLDVWAGVLPTGRLHVVTVPPRGGSRDQLWPRFCAAAGLPVDAAPVEPRRTNESLGLPEAQLMLALNRELGDDAARGGRFHRTVSRVVAPRLAAGSTVSVDLPVAADDWALDVAEHWLTWLDGHQVDVVGDVADLAPTPPDSRGPRLDPAAPHPELAAVAAQALSVLLEHPPAPPAG